MPAEALITNTSSGLYCPAGDFYIDAWKPVKRTITTHAHSGSCTLTEGGKLSNRARWVAICAAPANGRGGKNRYAGIWRAHRYQWSSRLVASRGPYPGIIASTAGTSRRDLGVHWRLQTPGRSHLQAIRISEMSHAGISECTFGLPIFRWRDPVGVLNDINQWWRQNAAEGKTSLLIAYCLGKAQRVLANHLIQPLGQFCCTAPCSVWSKPIGKVAMELPAAEHASTENAKKI